MNVNNTKSLANLELLRTIHEESEIKGIPVKTVTEVVQHVISELANRQYGLKNVCAEIDQKTGSVCCFRKLIVIGDESSNANHSLKTDDAESSQFSNTDVSKQNIHLPTIKLSQAVSISPDAKIGEIIKEKLPNFAINNSSMRNARNIMYSKMKEIDRLNKYENFKDRVGEIMISIVQKVDLHSIIVEIGGSSACLPIRNTINGEVIRKGDQCKVYIESVENKTKGHQILVSRTHPNFLLGMFKESIPEITDGIVELVGVARDPGSRSKVAVRSTDKNIDPVGSCIGIRGARIQSIISEVKGEKIDIVEHSSDPATFAVNAMSPAEVIRVIVDTDSSKMEVVVPEEQLSLAIGRKGQNVRLASSLIGWKLDVMGDADASEKRLREFNETTEMFKNALDVESVIAQLLVTENFMKVEDVAQADITDLSSIEGFDDEIANEIIERASAYIIEQRETLQSQIESLGMEKDLIDLVGDQENEMIFALGEQGIITLKDFADLSRDELIDLYPKLESEKKLVDSLIMSARSKMGWLD